MTPLGNLCHWPLGDRAGPVGLPVAAGCNGAPSQARALRLFDLVSPGGYLSDMLTPPTSAAAVTLRDTLRDNGYTGERLHGLAGNLDPPIPGTPRWYRLEGELDPGALPDALVLWFFLGAAIRTGAVAPMSAPFRSVAEETGLLREEDGWLIPQVLLVPVLGLWIASDRFQAPRESLPHGDTRADGGPVLPDDPVLGVGPAPIHVDRFALRTPARTVLDLCAGGGILTLTQLPTAGTITATDLSGRALDFARFNIALNASSVRTPETSPPTGGDRATSGTSAAATRSDAGTFPDSDRNLELLEGDLFAPVAGRKFERIVCNPPFILMPAGVVGLSGAGESSASAQQARWEASPGAGGLGPIDSLCERIVRTAPDHLEEGGTFQMIFEWPEHEGEDWRERLSGWVRGSGCDAWFVHANQQPPLAYVEARVREMEPLGATEPLGLRFRRWTTYFRDHGVEMLHGGFLLLRRRQSLRNWIRFDEVEGDLAGRASDEVAAAIRRYDLLESLEEGTPAMDIGSSSDASSTTVARADAGSTTVAGACGAAGSSADADPSPLAGASAGAAGSVVRVEPLGEGVLSLGALATLALRPSPSLKLTPLEREGHSFVRLETGRGWIRRVIVQPEIAAFVQRFEGGVCAREAIAGLASEMGRSVEQIGPEVSRVVRGLFEKGFLEPAMD